MNNLINDCLGLGDLLDNSPSGRSLLNNPTHVLSSGRFHVSGLLFGNDLFLSEASSICEGFIVVGFFIHKLIVLAVSLVGGCSLLLPAHQIVEKSSKGKETQAAATEKTERKKIPEPAWVKEAKPLLSAGSIRICDPVCLALLAETSS